MRVEIDGIVDVLTEYIAALEEIYPVAKGAAQVLPRQDNRTIVSIAYVNVCGFLIAWKKSEQSYCLRLINILFCRADDLASAKVLDALLDERREER